MGRSVPGTAGTAADDDDDEEEVPGISSGDEPVADEVAGEIMVVPSSSLSLNRTCFFGGESPTMTLCSLLSGFNDDVGVLVGVTGSP